MTRLGKRAEPILDTHNLVDTLVTGANHLAELVGRVMASLQDARFAR